MAKLAVPADHGGVSTGATYEVDGPEKVLAALEGSETLAKDVGGLTSDLAPQVQQCAMITMGRLASLSDPLRANVSGDNMIAHAVATISSAASGPLVKSALYMLQSCVRGSADAGRAAVDAGALPPICERIEDADATIKLAAVWCLSSFCSHDAPLAQNVAESGALPLGGTSSCCHTA